MVHTFGDSFTYGFCLTEDSPKRRIYSNGEMPKRQVKKTYGKIIAEYYGTEFKNYGVPGYSWLDILKSITSNLRNIKPNDYVIIGGTTLTRMMLPAKAPNGGDTLKSYIYQPHRDTDFNRVNINANFPKYDNLGKKVTESTLNGIFNNVSQLAEKGILPFYENYSNYYYTWIQDFLPFFTDMNVKALYWDYLWWDDIKIELNGEGACDCGHWNELSHNLMAEKLISYLEKGETIMLSNSSKVFI